MTEPILEFRLDSRSGVAPYLQIAEQVRHALRVGALRVGDQLPTIKDVVATLAVNPNTVLKAYRELEREGLVDGRPGLGTFVRETLEGPPPGAYLPLRRDLERWIGQARQVGLDDEAILSLVAATIRDDAGRRVA